MRCKRRSGFLCLLMLCCCLVLPAFAAEEGAVGELHLAGKNLDVRERMRAEIPLGDLCADAVRETAGADFAIVNAGDLSTSHLRYGEVTAEQIRASFTEDRQLAVAEVTAEQLREILEAAVASMTADPETELILKEQSESPAFPQVSGLRFTCDVPNLVGHKVIYLRDESGTFLEETEPGRLYTLAATGHMLSGGYGLPAAEGAEPLGMTLSEALCAYFEAHGTVEDVQTGRIELAGTADDKLISRVPVAIVVVALLFFTLAGLMHQRMKNAI